MSFPWLVVLWSDRKLPMSATPLQFPEHLQQAINAGVLCPETAWHLLWDVTTRPLDPWPPGLLPYHQRLMLYHQQGMAMQ